MAQKSKSQFVCNQCGYVTSKWYGQCPGCREWDTMTEEVVQVRTEKTTYKTTSSFASATQISRVKSDVELRYKTGMKELDRVLGGGIVKGSLILLSGDPGIGKSTILLQICEYLGRELEVLYVSGEESAHQIKLRADRLSVSSDKLSVMCETDVQGICEYVRMNKPDLVIVDSIQTMNFTELSSSPGSVAQVRECTNVLMRAAKSLEIPIIIVGHVNKDGNIAGPKVLEHIVDCVLYFEGDRNLSYRILRAVKNRYGSTNEIGVFDMLDTGLSEIENPSQMLISGRPQNTSGTCIACAMEGSRPILAEVQGLVAPTGFGNPRRMATGFDYSRMAMLLAVLEKRSGYFFGNMDAYINVVGGLKLDEPATDLPVAISLVSSLKDIVVPEDILAFGEVGLTGEIRGVNHCDQRLLEASRLGFKRCIIPAQNYRKISDNVKKSIEVIAVRTVRDAIGVIL